MRASPMTVRELAEILADAAAKPGSSAPIEVDTGRRWRSALYVDRTMKVEQGGRLIRLVVRARPFAAPREAIRKRIEEQRGERNAIKDAADSARIESRAALWVEDAVKIRDALRDYESLHPAAADGVPCLSDALVLIEKAIKATVRG